MQWQPRSMIAPPPVRRPSQNQAECGPGMRLARADPGDVADRAGPHRRDRLERLGRVAQVLEIAAEDAGRLDRLEHPTGLLGGPPERLRAEHRLAGLCRELDRLLVEEVRQRDDDDVGVGVVDGGRQVGGRLGDAPALAERLAALGTARVDDPDAVAAALAVERVACRSRRSVRCRASRSRGRPWVSSVRWSMSSRGWRPRTRSRPATRARSLAVVAQRAVWLKPQSGTSVRRSGGTPAARTASIRSATSSAVSRW